MSFTSLLLCMYFLDIYNIILVCDDNIILLNYNILNKIIFIKSKVKYIRKDDKITVDK